jgi:hypothetical protein
VFRIASVRGESRLLQEEREGEATVFFTSFSLSSSRQGNATFLTAKKSLICLFYFYLSMQYVCFLQDKKP